MTTLTETTGEHKPILHRVPYAHEKFPADNYQNNLRFKLFLREGFIPSTERREPGFVIFDFTPHKSGDHYREQPFPSDYENTERYKALIALGYKPVIKKTEPAGKVTIDFEPLKSQTLDLIVNVTPVMEPQISSRDAIDYAENSHTLWTDTKEDFVGPISAFFGYLSSGIRRGVTFLNANYVSPASQAYLERKRQRREKRQQRRNLKNHMYDSRRL